MKTNHILCIISVILLLGCNSKNSKHNDKYQIYQTFDEYKLEGVKPTEGKLRVPYVKISRNDSLIIVILCYEGKEPDKYLFYHNKGKFWYNINKDQVDPKLYFTTLCDTVPRFTERYIFNDTIMEYGYDLEQLYKMSSKTLIFKTKRNKIYIDLPSEFKIGNILRFEKLKSEVIEYKNIYLNQGNKKVETDKDYCLYDKVRRGDTLYMYEMFNTDEIDPSFRYEVRLYNSLGEIDPNTDNTLNTIWVDQCTIKKLRNAQN